MSKVASFENPARIFCILIIISFLLYLLPVIFFENDSKDVLFVQHSIEANHLAFDSLTFFDRLAIIRSDYALALNQLFNGDSLSIDRDNPQTVFAKVFYELPYYSIVYPTETYYYFSIPSENLAGNLLLKDIATGKISFAYYSLDDVRTYNSKILGSDQGLTVLPITASLYKVTYAGKSVYFETPSNFLIPPPEGLLTENEVFVSRILDESGIRFYLVYNEEHHSFYYILDEELPVPESLLQLGDNLLVGERTGFAYYNDIVFERKILFGVHTQNILDNNYYDGPFDQVPPKLPLRERLYAAYPYTQYLHGLDPYGVFLDFEGSRVAISAYTDYIEVTTLREKLDECELNDVGDLRWVCLTHEQKKEFHKTLPEFFTEDGACINNCLLR